MAWKMSAAKRRALVKLQLRDKNGRWIEMGGGVKWYSSKLKKEISGTVVGTQGNAALVRLNKENPTHEPALVKVNARSIEVVDSKASLKPKEGVSADQTPEFEKPKAVGRGVQRDNGSATELPSQSDSPEDYSVSETSDGNTYISRKDGEQLYFPARGLRAGDELLAPAGADPTKPFSIGRGWATKGAERLNNNGPLIGKVLSVDGDRYAIVQLPDGHTVIDRHTGEPSDLVTVGLSNKVIKATPGLKTALADKLSKSTFSEAGDAEEEEIDENDPKAGISDHVGREVPEDLQGDDESEVSDKPTLTSLKLRGKVFDEIEAAVRRSEVDPGIRFNGPIAEVYDAGAARNTLQGPIQSAQDMEGSPNTDEQRTGASLGRSLNKILETLVRFPDEPQDSPEAAPEKKKPLLSFNVKGGTKDEIQFGIETQESDGRDPGIVIEGNKANVHDIDNAIYTIDGLAEVLSDNLLDGVYETSAERATARRKHDGLKKIKERLVEAKNEQPEEAPENAPEPAEAPAAPAVDETPVEEAPEAPEEVPAPQPTAEEVAEPTESPVEDAPVTEEAPEAPAEVYNQNGLTDAEETEAAAAMRLANRAYDRFDLEAGDRYSELADSIMARGQERKDAGLVQETPVDEAPEASPEPETAPESAPNAEEAPESAPEADSPAEEPTADIEEVPADAPNDEPEQSEEDTAKADAALAESGNAGEGFELKYARASSGLEQAIVSDDTELTDEEAAELRDLNAKLAMAQHENRSARESVVRGDIKKLSDRIKDRLNAPAQEEEAAPETEAPTEEEREPLNGEPGYVPIDGRGMKDEEPQEDQNVDPDEEEPPVQEEADPISDEEAGRVLTALTSDNPLPEGVERHVPEAIEGETFPPTQQQQDVIDSVLAGLNTLVQAKAGAGKTSTLRAIARRLKLARPDDKVGYIAFNKTVQLEANATMPDNVEARTGHSIAYNWSPDWMKRRSNDSAPIRRPADVARHLGITEPMANGDKAFSPTDQAMAVTRTVDTFANSDFDNVSREHLPDSVQSMPEHIQDAIVAKAQEAWTDLSSETGRLRMSLDHMRKHWALSRPDFSQAGSGLRRPINVMFLDEAQDTPPVLAKVVADQSIQKVIVGDADQAIYAFTGATDYLSDAEGDVELPLNKSWRFGPQVADMGNRFLQLLGSPGRVEGGGPNSKIVEGMSDADAVLVRSNGGMLSEIARELEAGRTVGVPKGTKKDLESLIESARYLRGEGSAPTKMHDDLAAFRTWAEFTEEEAKGDDPTLSKIKRMVDTRGLDGMEELISRITETGDVGLEGVTFEDHEAGLIAGGNTWGVASMTARGERTHFSNAGFRWMDHPDGTRYTSGRNRGQVMKAWVATGTPEQREQKLARLRELASGPTPDVVISTAHKSKGLEWGRVRIGDDFFAPKDDGNGGITLPKPEELRLNYVAVTRAEKELDLGSLAWVMEHTEPNGGDSNVSAQREAEDAPKASAPEEDSSESEEATPEETEEAPKVAEVVPEQEPEEPTTEPETPDYDEDGLSPSEKAYFDYLNTRLSGAYQGTNDEDTNHLESEIDGLLRNGEARLNGEDRPEYEPQEPPAADDVEEAPEEPTVKEETPIASGRRPRSSYNGVMVTDSEGNAVTAGDTIGHPTLGPVTVTGVVPSAQRIKFINPQTGLEGSVAGNRVRRIDPDVATPEAAPVAEDLPTTPGTIIVDPATGKKGFIDKNGNKVLVGDLVISRDGTEATVKAVYPGANGVASVALDFNDGTRNYPRQRGAILEKAGVVVPDPAEESAPEATPAPALIEPDPETRVDLPAPAPDPETRVDLPAPAEVTPEITAEDMPLLPIDVVERARVLIDAPIGTTIESGSGMTTYTKMSEDGWTSNFAQEMSTPELTSRTATNGPWRVFEPEASTEAPVDSSPYGTLVSGDYNSRLETFGFAPVGSVATIDFGDTDLGTLKYTKIGDNEWFREGSRFNPNGYHKNNAEIARLSLNGDGGIKWYMDTNPTPVEETNPAPVEVGAPYAPINHSDQSVRRSALDSLPIGSKVVNDNYTFEKTGPDAFTNQYSSVYNLAEMATLTDNNFGAFGANWKLQNPDGSWATSPAEIPIPAAPRATPKPKPTFRDDFEVGSFMPSTPGSRAGLMKTGDNEWEMVDDNGDPTGRKVDNNAASVVFDLTKPVVQGPVPDYGLSDLDGEGRTYGDFIADATEADTEGWSQYRFTRDLSEEQYEKLRAAYKKFIDEVNRKLPEGFTAKLIEEPNFAGGRGRFFTKVNFYKNGRTGRIGYADRQFGVNDIFGQKRAQVYHAFFELDRDIQGSGINNAFLAESLKFYEQLGLDAVRVTANIDVGGYTWARSGFDFFTYETMQDTINSMSSRMYSMRRQLPEMSDEKWNTLIAKFHDLKSKATRENFEAGTAPSAFEWSQLGYDSTMPRGRDSMWLGKKLMLGLNWSGVRSIDGERDLRK